MALIATYLVVGVSAGGVIGLLRPLTYHGVGAYIVGLFAGAPIGIGLTLCVKGLPAMWPEVVWSGLPVLCVLIGLAVGHELRKNAKREDNDLT